MNQKIILNSYYGNTMKLATRSECDVACIYYQDSTPFLYYVRLLPNFLFFVPCLKLLQSEVHNIALLGINTNKCFKWSYGYKENKIKEQIQMSLKGWVKRREDNIVYTNLTLHDLTHKGSW